MHSREWTPFVDADPDQQLPQTSRYACFIPSLVLIQGLHASRQQQR